MRMITCHEWWDVIDMDIEIRVGVDHMKLVAMSGDIKKEMLVASGVYIICGI